MAKQTFTTGQVLTAAQMTSLQQTAMGGGSTTAKTASYVLVAADAGTVVQMNAAGATTITVNTALFAAGDVVFLQNIGAGICTITAGTATVSTAGSLALTQFEGGQLYFTAAGASVFFDYIQASAAAPSYTQLATGSLSGNSTSITGLASDNLIIFYYAAASSAAGQDLILTFNSSTTAANYVHNYYEGNYTLRNGDVGSIGLSTSLGNDYSGFITVSACKSSGSKPFNYSAGKNNSATGFKTAGIGYFAGSTITSVQLKLSGVATFTAGTYVIFGAN